MRLDILPGSPETHHIAELFGRNADGQFEFPFEMTFAQANFLSDVFDGMLPVILPDQGDGMSYLSVRSIQLVQMRQEILIQVTDPLLHAVHVGQSFIETSVEDGFRQRQTDILIGEFKDRYTAECSDPGRSEGNTHHLHPARPVRYFQQRSHSAHKIRLPGISSSVAVVISEIEDNIHTTVGQNPMRVWAFDNTFESPVGLYQMCETYVGRVIFEHFVCFQIQRYWFYSFFLQYIVLYMIS